MAFVPQRTKLTAGRPRQVLLLVRDDAVKDRSEILADVSDGFSVHPETSFIDSEDCPRWPPHKRFYAVGFSLTSNQVGHHGELAVLVEARSGEPISATLHIEDVLLESLIQPPETMEFRPETSTGRPGRKNNLILYVNPTVVAPGHYVRIQIDSRTGDVQLVAPDGSRCDTLDIKLDNTQHRVKGQDVFRVLIPWHGTAWNQHAHVVATVKVAGAKPLTTEGRIRLDEPEEGGFFREVKYGEIDPKAPSQFAAGVITVNINDRLNQLIFGKSRDEFDRRLSTKTEAQQRLASLLLEEASFRALEHNYNENRIPLPERQEVTKIHEHIDAYKFDSAADVYQALARARA